MYKIWPSMDFRHSITVRFSDIWIPDSYFKLDFRPWIEICIGFLSHLKSGLFWISNQYCTSPETISFYVGLWFPFTTFFFHCFRLFWRWWRGWRWFRWHQSFGCPHCTPGSLGLVRCSCCCSHQPYPCPAGSGFWRQKKKGFVWYQGIEKNACLGTNSENKIIRGTNFQENGWLIEPVFVILNN